MAPDGTHFHATERLPDILPRRDVAILDDDRALRGEHRHSNRRGFLIDASADPAEDRKRHDDHQSKRYPQAFHLDPRL